MELDAQKMASCESIAQTIRRDSQKTCIVLSAFGKGQGISLTVTHIEDAEAQRPPLVILDSLETAFSGL